jgi:ABC-type dipeptide/oligopeptide/nickel transport system permease subunit
VLLAAGSILFLLFLIVAAVGPFVAEDPNALSIEERFSSPSWNHWLGTNQFGHDLLAQTVAACRSSLAFAIAPMLGGFLPGAILAAAAARYVPRRGALVREVAQTWHALPIVPVAVVAASASFLAGWSNPLAVVVGIGAFFTGLATASSLPDPIDVRTSAATLGSAAALTMTSVIGTHAAIGYLGLAFSEPGSSDFGPLIFDNVSRALEYEYLLLPAVVLWTILFGFWLIRRALDDIDPPRTYER